MAEVANVVLALEPSDIAEEVMHFLDRTGRVRVVATASDERQLSEAAKQLEPTAIIASPSLLGRQATGGGAKVLALDTAESVRGLRSAMSAGADGFFVWPADRSELADAAAASARPRVIPVGQTSRLITVCGARGGSGSTFVATHLAAAFAAGGERCVLVDLDPLFGEVASALGVRDDDDDVHTIGSLDPVSGELSDDHLDDVLWQHPSGFRVLHAPRAFDAPELGRADRYASALDAIATQAGVVVLHAPRGLTDLSRVALDRADRVLIVVSLDVMAFHCARRLLGVLEDDGPDERVGFVVNRAARAEIVPSDVARVFGRAPLAVIPQERTVASLQDRGRLLPANGRLGRMFSRLADQLVQTADVA